jgi:hypothetical protein
LSFRLLSDNVNIRIYDSIILPAVLYWCETWSQTLRKEYRLKIFENVALRRMFGPRRNEIIQGWRELHNGELHNWYYLPNIIRMIKSGSMR